MMFDESDDEIHDQEVTKAAETPEKAIPTIPEIPVTDNQPPRVNPQSMTRRPSRLKSSPRPTRPSQQRRSGVPGLRNAGKLW